MPCLVEINDNIFMSVKQAAEHFNYSRDHVTRLAKAKKIEAVLSGRTWLVSRKSLGNYYEDQKLESEVRKRLLRSERQIELEVRSKLAKSDEYNSRTYEKSGLCAVTLACVFFSLCFLVTNQVTSSAVGHKALVSSAITVDGSAVSTAESEFIQPVFTNGSEVSVTSVERKLDRPAVTPQWVLISHD